jgi:hypothetical protein
MLQVIAEIAARRLCFKTRISRSNLRKDKRVHFGIITNGYHENADIN